MPLHVPIINQEEYPVTAYLKETGEFIGDYPNASIAARKLFIRSKDTIRSHILRPKNKKAKKPAGVKSRKTGIVYLFEYSKS